MVAGRFIVVLDANVLFPFTLRDTLLRAASLHFYQVRWTTQILDAWAPAGSKLAQSFRV